MPCLEVGEGNRAKSCGQGEGRDEGRLCRDLLANAVMGSPIPVMPYKVLGLLENSKAA